MYWRKQVAAKCLEVYCPAWATTEKLAASMSHKHRESGTLCKTGDGNARSGSCIISGMPDGRHCTERVRFSHSSHYVSHNFFFFPIVHLGYWSSAGIPANMHGWKKGLCHICPVLSLLFTAHQPRAGLWTSQDSPSSSGNWTQWAFPQWSIKDPCEYKNILKSKLKSKFSVPEVACTCQAFLWSCYLVSFFLSFFLSVFSFFFFFSF